MNMNFEEYTMVATAITFVCLFVSTLFATYYRVTKDEKNTVKWDMINTKVSVLFVLAFIIMFFA